MSEGRERLAMADVSNASVLSRKSEGRKSNVEGGATRRRRKSGWIPPPLEEELRRPMVVPKLRLDPLEKKEQEDVVPGSSVERRDRAPWADVTAANSPEMHSKLACDSARKKRTRRKTCVFGDIITGSPLEHVLEGVFHSPKAQPRREGRKSFGSNQNQVGGNVPRRKSMAALPSADMSHAEILRMTSELGQMADSLLPGSESVDQKNKPKDELHGRSLHEALKESWKGKSYYERLQEMVADSPAKVQDHPPKTTLAGQGKSANNAGFPCLSHDCQDNDVDATLSISARDIASVLSRIHNGSVKVESQISQAGDNRAHMLPPQALKAKSGIDEQEKAATARRVAAMQKAAAERRAQEEAKWKASIEAKKQAEEQHTLKEEKDTEKVEEASLQSVTQDSTMKQGMISVDPEPVLSSRRSEVTAIENRREQDEMQSRLKAQESEISKQRKEFERMKQELAEKNRELEDTRRALKRSEAERDSERTYASKELAKAEVAIAELRKNVAQLMEQKIQWEQRSRTEAEAVSQKAKYRARAAEQRVVMLSEQLNALRVELVGLHDDISL